MFKKEPSQVGGESRSTVGGQGHTAVRHPYQQLFLRSESCLPEPYPMQADECPVQSHRKTANHLLAYCAAIGQWEDAGAPGENEEWEPILPRARYKKTLLNINSSKVKFASIVSLFCHYSYHIGRRLIFFSLKLIYYCLAWSSFFFFFFLRRFNKCAFNFFSLFFHARLCEEKKKVASNFSVIPHPSKRSSQESVPALIPQRAADSYCATAWRCQQQQQQLFLLRVTQN